MVQLCHFSRLLRAATWFDRLAKWVFQKPVAQLVTEFWLPAKHDSGDQGVVAERQKQADVAATRGLDDPDRYPVPWDVLLLVPHVPPGPVCYQGLVVLNINVFIDRLYGMSVGRSSALGRWVLEQGFDASPWVRVRHDPTPVT